MKAGIKLLLGCEYTRINVDQRPVLPNMRSFKGSENLPTEEL